MSHTHTHIYISACKVYIPGLHQHRTLPTNFLRGYPTVALEPHQARQSSYFKTHALRKIREVANKNNTILLNIIPYLNIHVFRNRRINTPLLVIHISTAAIHLHTQGEQKKPKDTWQRSRMPPEVCFACDFPHFH